LGKVTKKAMIKRLLFYILLLLTSFGVSAVRVDTVTVATKHLATPMKLIVYTPDAASAGGCFPTVYMLHGFAGDYTNWSLKEPRLAGLADSYGMILVFPDGRDSWYWDSPVDKSMQMESAITCDVVPYIDRPFPTVADREHRAITGLSMGGHGSLWLASRHPDIWGNAGSMSGGVNILPFPKSWRMSERLGAYETNKEVWKKHSVINNIDAIKAAKLNIIFDCGADDFFAGVNEDLHKRLLEAKIPHDYTSRPGNHSWDYWRNSALYHLLFFNEAFRKADAQDVRK